MQTEACLICDSASDYQGRLCVLGVFDTIVAGQTPHNHPHSAMVVRLRFERSEEGKHPFRLMLIDEDGQPTGPRVDGEVNVAFRPNQPSVVVNVILAMNNLVLTKYGTFHFDLAIDGRQVASVPMYVVPTPPQIKKAA